MAKHHNRFLLPGCHANPILRVGLDVDNTLLRNDFVWRNRFRQPCVARTPHRFVPHDEVSTAYDHFRRICAPCFEECMHSPSIILAHEPMPGAIEAVRKLHTLAVEFHVITARPETNIEPTLDWFENVGIYDHIGSVTFAEQKRPVCEELHLDYIVDDSPDVLIQMTTPQPSSTKILFLDGTHNRDIITPHRVESWNEILSALLPQSKVA